VIDTDIFQIATLVLLLLALVVSLVVLSTLGKIRKRLEERGTGMEGGGVAPVTGAWAERPAAQQAAAQPAAAAQARPTAAAHPLEETSYGEAAAQPAAAQPAAAQAAAQPAAAAEPQEQPFERDGRWWFRRGDELLVYEESTGQWQPAGAGSAPAGGTAPMPATEGVATGTETGGHWKCPTCGAVNGSTAASCRMCFTPRP
jgi:hypothetical protein